MSNSNATKVMPTYFNQLPVSFDHGRGAWLWDANGNEYLDSLSGIAVCGLGHAHPDITKTITEQAGKVLHTSNTYLIAKQIELAEKLARVAGMEQVYFCNSGAEANEAAIKLARVYARKKQIAEPVIVTMKNSFHGRSMATLSASGSERLQTGFEPLVRDFVHVELNNMAELDAVVKTYEARIIAIMLEPIQGDGGVVVAHVEYLERVRELCDSWLISAEVQTGMGERNGCASAYLITRSRQSLSLGKRPIGACLARGKASNLFGPGKHGSTFGGNPFVTAVGCTVIDVMEKQDLVNQAARLGAYLVDKLKSVLAKHAGVSAVRGMGLMIGVELDRPCLDLPALGLKHKLLFNITANKVIRLLPPLIITEKEADEIVARLDGVLAEYLRR